MGNPSHAIRNLALTAALLLATVPVGLGGKVQSAEGRQSIIVELSGLPPSVVAAEQARKQGKAFDRAAHDRAVIGSQQTLLSKLRRAGIDYTLTETPMQLAGARKEKPNRFSYLINAVGLEVPASAVEIIRRMPGVRHVTLDEPVHLNLDNSVKYVRASNGPGNKAIFTQGGGPLTRFDGSQS